jgi:hypothetical protein
MTRVRQKSRETNHCDCGNPLGRDLGRKSTGTGLRCDACIELDEKLQHFTRGTVEPDLTDAEQQQLDALVPPDLQPLVRQWAARPRRHALYRVACLHCGEESQGGPVPVWELGASAFDVRCQRCGGQCFAEDLYDFDYYPLSSHVLVAQSDTEVEQLVTEPVATATTTTDRGLRQFEYPTQDGSARYLRSKINARRNSVKVRLAKRNRQGK